MNKLNKESTILEIKKLKEKYAQEGFRIHALFGSIAREDFNESSDVDILYESDEKFLKKYSGFSAFAKLEEISEEIKNATGRDVDLASKKYLGEIGKKYILRDLIYV